MKPSLIFTLISILSLSPLSFSWAQSPTPNFVSASEPDQPKSNETNFGKILNRLFIDNPYADRSIGESYPESQNDFDLRRVAPRSWLLGSPNELPPLSYPKILPFADLRGKTIISLGEGESSLVAELNRNGIKAYGTDYCYRESSLARIGKKNAGIGKFLCRYFYADATRADQDVREVLGPRFSADHIFAHALLCCLDQPMAIATVIKSLRLLKVGGTFRAFIVHHWEGFYGKAPVSGISNIAASESRFLRDLQKALIEENLKASVQIHADGVETHLVIEKQ